MKRNIRPTNLYLKFLRKILRKCLIQETLLTESKIWRRRGTQEKNLLIKLKLHIPIGGIETFDQNKITNGFNKVFPEIGPKLSS